MITAMTTLVLASASPARLRILNRAGVFPIVQPSTVDEPATVEAAEKVHGPLAAEDLTLLLARAKAEDVAKNLPAGLSAFIIGCDSMLELNGELHGKPQDIAQARARWEMMRNNSGIVYTGHWLIDARTESSGATIGATAATTVHFGSPTPIELDAYLATGEPLAVAGAFTTDSSGGAFIRGIEGDHHNVVGLSLPLLRDLLADCGVIWTELWSQPAR